MSGPGLSRSAAAPAPSVMLLFGQNVVLGAGGVIAESNTRYLAPTGGATLIDIELHNGANAIVASHTDNFTLIAHMYDATGALVYDEKITTDLTANSGTGTIAANAVVKWSHVVGAHVTFPYTLPDGYSFTFEATKTGAGVAVGPWTAWMVIR